MKNVSHFLRAARTKIKMMYLQYLCAELEEWGRGGVRVIQTNNIKSAPLRRWWCSRLPHLELWQKETGATKKKYSNKIIPAFLSTPSVDARAQVKLNVTPSRVSLATRRKKNNFGSSFIFGTFIVNVRSRHGSCFKNQQRILHGPQDPTGSCAVAADNNNDDTKQMISRAYSAILSRLIDCPFYNGPLPHVITVDLMYPHSAK